MTDKQIFREVFNYFVRYAPGPPPGGEEAYWLAASQELGEVCGRLGGSKLAVDLLCAVYMELERRMRSRPQPANAFSIC